MNVWWVADCDDCDPPLTASFNQGPRKLVGAAKAAATEWAQEHSNATGHVLTVREEIR